MIVEPLQGKAAQAIGHKASIVAFEGSVRSGKTWASLLEWIEYCRRGPVGYLVMVGKTERTLITNCILPLQQFLGPKRVKLSSGTGRVNICGREVMLRGANDIGAVTKIQGPTYAGAYVDEASTVPEVFFNMLVSRLSVAGAQLFLTSNPESPAHWLKVNWLDKARLWIDRGGNEIVREMTYDDSGEEDGKVLDLVRVSFTLDDNAPNLPPAYIARMKSSYVGLWYRRFIMGEWCIAEGAVYDMWDPVRHVVKAKDMPAVARLLGCGIDYGTNHPSRGYLVALTAEAKPRLAVVDEWDPGKLTDAGLSASLRKWLRGRPVEWLFVDPAAASLKLQLFADGFGNVADADNAVLPGIRTVASLLATDALVVSDVCQKLIAEVPGYSWDPKATLRGEDAPIKANDDSCDALRYGVMSTRALWGTAVPLTLPIEEAA